jgi:hypothetical protein
MYSCADVVGSTPLKSDRPLSAADQAVPENMSPASAFGDVFAGAGVTLM